MIKKAELQFALDSICIDIFDEIISPMCDIARGTIVADTYQTDLNEFFETPREETLALKKIAYRYDLQNNSEEYLENLPIILIALYVLIHGKYNEDYKGVRK